MRFDEHTTPLYSLVLKGMVITSTGISGDDLTLLQRRIMYLGGVFTLELSMTNTHLIAGRVDGPKWKASVDTRRPILKPSYIKDTWAQQTKGGL